MGPTIKDDPKQPAAATAGAGKVPEGQSSANGAETAQERPGGSAGSSPATAAPEPSATKTTYTFGGGIPFELGDGALIEVVEARIDRSLDTSVRSELVPVVVRTRITNGTDNELWPYRIDVQVHACGQPPQRCNEIDGPAKKAQLGKMLVKGSTDTVDWFVYVSPEHLSALTVVIRDPLSGGARFTGSAK
ncbi:hypothetical protein [Yinghuangia sp. YIM S10712]|uniref:hypothetical protein n=1 Tax=Yinghuangia sp. YIM S10712 TaxID=3436930 RepID=UPI003F52B908